MFSFISIIQAALAHRAAVYGGSSTKLSAHACVRRVCQIHAQPRKVARPGTRVEPNARSLALVVVRQ